MKFAPFDLPNMINDYFDHWQEFELEDEFKLNKRQLNKLVKLIEQHPEAELIYQDFEQWFSKTSQREDIMSDTFTDILDEAFEELVEEAA